MSLRSICVLAAVLGTVFALLIPPYTGPDEKGHMAYVSALAQGHMPLLGASHVADLDTGTTYQAQHPPLFYFIASPFYRLINNPTHALYTVRLLGVILLVVIVVLVDRLARVLDGVHKSSTAAFLCATHPVLIYGASQVNNETLALTFAVACVWCCAEATHADKVTLHRSRWLLAAAVCGGLGVVTKLTAITGVVAGFFLLIQNSTSGRRILQSIVFLAGSMIFYLAWAIYSYRLYGTMMPELFEPVFPAGFGQVLLVPLDALYLACVTLGEFAVGLIYPMWLLHPLATLPSTYARWTIGCGLALYLGFVAVYHHKVRFAVAGFTALYALILIQEFFRDKDVLVHAARYTASVIPLLAPFVAHQFDSAGIRTQRVLTISWILFAAMGYAYILYFFLHGFPRTSSA